MAEVHSLVGTHRIFWSPSSLGGRLGCFLRVGCCTGTAVNVGECGGAYDSSVPCLRALGLYTRSRIIENLYL